MTGPDPDGLSALMAGRPGVYVLDELNEDQVNEDQVDEEQLVQAGWRLARLGPVHDLDSFYNELSRALGLPSWFGHNLDALWEVLVDLDQPTLMSLVEAESMMRELPTAWRRLLNVLRERADLPPSGGVAFAVLTHRRSYRSG